MKHIFFLQHNQCGVKGPYFFFFFFTVILMSVNLIDENLYFLFFHNNEYGELTQHAMLGVKT